MGLGRLDGKVALITGGASGIGEGTVRLFVDEGARVVIADVQDSKGERLADTLGGRAIYQRTDVAQEADVKAAVQRAVDDYGRLDCLFNNAGFGGAVGPIEEIPVDDYDRTMNVLLRGVFLGMKHATPVMKAQGSGSIISTASVAGIKGGDGPHIYSTAKAAVIHLTRTVALELGESGIRVNCICPGGIATPIFKGAFQGQELDDAAIVETVKPFLAQFQPIKRAGVPQDIANAALFLASDESSFVTGHAMVVDGGFTAGRMWSQQPEMMRAHRPMSW
jgi:NAD(P)-dependent dehydrogenase (short-subunit alcohol dehydrogenase family)